MLTRGTRLASVGAGRITEMGKGAVKLTFEEKADRTWMLWPIAGLHFMFSFVLHLGGNTYCAFGLRIQPAKDGGV